MNPENREEEILVRRARLTRERLLAVVDELDRKRHAVSHPMKLIANSAPPPATIASIAAAAIFAVGTIGYLVARSRRKRQRFFLRQPPPPSFVGDVASRTAKALLTFALVQAGKYALENVLPKASGPARLPNASRHNGVLRP